MLALLYYRLCSSCRNVHIVGQTVRYALKKLSDGSARKAILGKRTFYKTVIKYLQQMLPLDDILLKSLSCLNPREQRGYNSMQHCMVVAENMPNLSDEKQVMVGDEWAHYMEIEVKEEDFNLRVDYFWHKIFCSRDSSGDKFVVLPKMVKCVLALCHSNADVERSLSMNKRMLTRLNTGMSEKKNVDGLRSVKAAVQEYGHASKVPISLEMVKLVQNSYRLYSLHLREEQEKKKHKEREKEQAKAHKRELSEMKQEKRLHDRLDQLTSEHGAAKEAMQRAIRYAEKGGEKIKNSLKVQDMMRS